MKWRLTPCRHVLYSIKYLQIGGACDALRFVVPGMRVGDCGNVGHRGWSRDSWPVAARGIDSEAAGHRGRRVPGSRIDCFGRVAAEGIERGRSLVLRRLVLERGPSQPRGGAA